MDFFEKSEEMRLFCRVGVSPSKEKCFSQRNSKKRREEYRCFLNCFFSYVLSLLQKKESKGKRKYGNPAHPYSFFIKSEKRFGRKSWDSPSLFQKDMKTEAKIWKVSEAFDGSVENLLDSLFFQKPYDIMKRYP